MFGPSEIVEAKIRKRVGTFLQAKEVLAKLSLLEDGEIRAEAQKLSVPQKQLEKELGPTVALTDQSFSVGNSLTILDFARRMEAQIQDVKALAEAAGAKGFDIGEVDLGIKIPTWAKIAGVLVLFRLVFK